MMRVADKTSGFRREVFRKFGEEQSAILNYTGICTTAYRVLEAYECCYCKDFVVRRILLQDKKHAFIEFLLVVGEEVMSILINWRVRYCIGSRVP